MQLTISNQDITILARLTVTELQKLIPIVRLSQDTDLDFVLYATRAGLLTEDVLQLATFRAKLYALKEGFIDV